MMRQPFDLLGYPVPNQGLDGLDDARMEHPPPLQQEAPVSHLVREGVLEGVFALGKEARLVEKFGGLEMRQAALQALFWCLDNGLQQWQRHFHANDGSGLEQALV